MKTIVFQGDSITDATRNREKETAMGHGYATMTAGKISVDYPGEYRFFNRGISGNRSVDLYARIKKDVINLQPDILTVLIGVNDVWHEFSSQNGVEAAKFEKILEMFLLEVRNALPDIKIFLLEPFVLPGTATEANLEGFRKEVSLRAAACKRLAEKLDIPFVPLQEKLEQMALKATNEAVLFDGVHPACGGHELISRELYRAMQAVL